jgi:hypothetical protein
MGRSLSAADERSQLDLVARLKDVTFVRCVLLQEADDG